MNVLLVDNNQFDREMVTQSILSGNPNAHITEANSISDGLSFYRTDRFDVVLLTHTMPTHNGIEMIIEIRDSDKNGNTPIVVMSSSDEEEIALKCIKEGAHDFILKSEITYVRLRRAILQASVRHELENKLFLSYQKAKTLAETDSLTNLPNRYYFEETLKSTITTIKRSKNTIALLLIDLDNFKFVNDSYGHDIGDILLKKVVNRISSCLRGDELFSRLGGDEFSITLSHLHSAVDASKVAKRIIAVLKKPFAIAETIIQTSASIGIAISNGDTLTSEEMVKHADIAMYRAKNQGRNQLCFFESEMQELFNSRMKIENSLRSAEENKEFYLHFQPIINPKTTKVQGFEALIRWSTNGENYRPDEFIPIAEETKQILSIGRWVIHESIATLGKWKEKLSDSYSMAINISSVQLEDATLCEYILAELAIHNISPARIELELTETAFLQDTEIAANTIAQLHSMGCKISLDDFGTGYSSISHLRNYPISIVKIDRSLMPSSELDLKNISLIEGLVAMTSILGLDVIAEGIETQHQANLCNSLGIQRVQGYFFSKPLQPNLAEAFCLAKSQ